jgi:ABC-type oligopeptide transport system substrate-binding subunit
MKGRFWLSAAMGSIGASLLVAAALAGSAAGASPTSADKSEVQRGGTLRIVSSSDFDYIDPQLAYFSHSWSMMGATQLRLYYYPMVDGPRNQRIEPMAAAGFPRVSANGRTYTINIKRGFKFSNGQNVTSANFVRAYQRGVAKAMQSPAASFLSDVSSWRANGPYGLRITLRTVAPDFLSRLTMFFFAAVPTGTSITAEGVKAPFLSAGPYYISEWTEGKSALAVRNPNWNNAREPYRSLRIPGNVNRITWQAGITPANQRLLCENNDADVCAFPPAQAKELADKYGINKGRFFRKSQLGNWYLAMNNAQPLFRGNASLRKAVNFAIDRRFMVAQHGYLAGRRTDQFLPYGMPGFREFNIYPLGGPNIARANQLASGNTRTGKAVFYTFNVAQGPPIAQSVQFNLKQIGLDVEIRQFDRVVQHEKTATRGEPFDFTLEGWLADYPDPSNFINVLLDGRRIQADNNVNVSYFNNAAFNRRMDAAYKTAGAARYAAYGTLDRDLVRDAAPVAPYISTSARVFVGPNVGCYGFAPSVGSLLVQLCKTG